MRKLFIGVITIITVAAVSTVLAQSFFGFGGGNPGQNATPAPSAPPGGQLSPSQFQSIVKSKAQQTQSDQKQQLQQLLNTPVPYASPQTTINPAPNQGGAPGGPAMSNAPAAAPTTMPNSAQPPSPATAPVNTFASPETTAPETQDFGISNPAPSSSQSQVYTGFGPGNQNSPPANNSTAPANSGGWNIKY